MISRERRSIGTAWHQSQLDRTMMPGAGREAEAIEASSRSRWLVASSRQRRRRAFGVGGGGKWPQVGGCERLTAIGLGDEAAGWVLPSSRRRGWVAVVRARPAFGIFEIAGRDSRPRKRSRRPMHATQECVHHAAIAGVHKKHDQTASSAKGLRIVRRSTRSPFCMSSLQRRVQPPSIAAATINAS
jgi:hypothetical protein